MARWLRYLVRIRGNRDRQLIIIGSILAVTCVALFINLTIMLTRNSSDSNKDPINNETISNISNLTTPGFSFEGKFYEHALGQPVEFKNRSYSLDNALYFNFPLFCKVDEGFVVRVSLRLFREWKGHAPLYLFVISAFTYTYTILHRFPINPQRNTTEWQTINIPSDAIPIIRGQFLGLGMYENSGSKNEIYAVEVFYPMAGIGVHANTTAFNITQEAYGVAFEYTVVYYDSITTTISTTIV